MLKNQTLSARMVLLIATIIIPQMLLHSYLITV